MSFQDLLLLDPEHIHELAKILKVVPRKKFLRMFGLTGGGLRNEKTM